MYAAALVVINITLSISELGVSVALVRHPGDPREIGPTVQTLALASSAALAGITVVACATAGRCPRHFLTPLA